MIELLSGAKNLESGIMAINSGADAVYIGAYKFGARVNAGNDLKDIKSLVLYAHKFNVKIYVVLNTILYDQELKEVQKIIDELDSFNIDGLIIQDFGILELDLHNIPVIASTQMHNIDINQVKFLEELGFKRVILGRELSLEEIKEIKSKSKIELESFIHGALCVSYSGRCYMSEYLAKKSGNRGECIQPCRLPYSLIDSEGKVLIKDKYLLSLKDLSSENDIEDLIDAGITSFKIEGRLKDVDYVSNVTYFYRKKIDEVLKKKGLKKSSRGEVFSDIVPDLEKTFNRSFTTYFRHGRQKDILALNSPKSLGKLMGKVKEVSKNYFILNRKHNFVSGDGICFFDKNNELKGSNVIKVEGEKIFLNEKQDLRLGDKIYRNFDLEFNKEIRKSGAIERKIPLKIIFKETQEGVYISFKVDTENYVSKEIKFKKEYSKNKEQALLNVKTHFSKLGNSNFYLKEIKIDFYKDPLFIPLSTLNQIRRDLIEELEEKLASNYKREKGNLNKNEVKYYLEKLSYENNVSNEKAESFYRKHGVKEINQYFDGRLMTTKHCLKYYLGLCGQNLKEPLYLVNEKGQKFLLKFNCEKCQMEIYKNNP